MNFESARQALHDGSDVAAIAREIVAAMTPAEKLWCLDGDAPFWAGLTDLGGGGYHRNPFHAARLARLGLPGFSFSDGPRGVVVDRATCFPVSMARGATWDVDLEERIGEAIGREIRAVGATLFGGVCVNVLRHPAWGRAQETYGEDPFHVGEFGAALARGVQRHAMACVKHFACNSMENSRFRVDVTVDEVALHEVFLPHFKRVVDEGVAVVMSAYNSVNGEWCGDSRALLTDVLRIEWGFQGFVISDWIFGLRDAAKSVTAGLDVEMPYRMIRATHLATALDAGEVQWADVERSIERVISTLLRFDTVLSAPSPGIDILACDDHRALAREAAAKSVVLLRNEPVEGAPVLPLDAGQLSSVAVIGELAAAINLGDGGSSDVWAPDVITILDGLQTALATSNVLFDDGADLDSASSLAATAEVAIVVVGYTYLDEGEFIGDGGTSHLRTLLPGPDDADLVTEFTREMAGGSSIQAPAHIADRPIGGFATGGDRGSLRLAERHVELIRTVAAANPRTVVAIVAGSAVVISEWDHSVAAIVQPWYSGMEGGTGLADVLIGAVDASGRLPFSVPTTEDHLPPFQCETDVVVYDRWHGWWHLDRQGHKPAYPFGFGLSYTRFDLDAGEVTVVGGDIRVGAWIHNAGERDGSDVVQVYARRIDSNGPGRLIGFARRDIPIGHTAAIDLIIPVSTLSERDIVAHTMRMITGSYEVRVARHASDPGITVVLDITDQNITDQNTNEQQTSEQKESS